MLSMVDAAGIPRLQAGEDVKPGGVMLPGRRYVHFNETVLVPKHALSDMPAEHKVEQGYYAGHVGGYGGTIDARR